MAIAGVLIYFAKDHAVFPAASIDLCLPKEQILARSEYWASTLGYELGRKDLKTVVFSYDNNAKTFLDYELGGSKANELMKEEIPVWSWRTRFCREFQQEELRVSLDPKGKITSIDHFIENDREMPSLDEKKAEELARTFIGKEVGKELTGYKLIRHQSDTRPKRIDHYFTFEDTQKSYQGSRLRILVGISGNKITQYSHYLHVPEEWQRKFSTIRSGNMLLASLAGIFYTLFSIVGAFVFLWGIMTGNIRWRFALAAAGVFTFFILADSVNTFSEYADEYITRYSWSAYVGQFWLRLLRSGLSQFVSALSVFAAAEIVYRAAFPKHVTAENMFSRKGLMTGPIVIGLAVGYLLFAVDLGWVCTYYLIGQNLGFWCPLGIDNYQVLSSYVPAFSAMNIGVMASSMEEALYRVIGMGLVFKLTRNFWLANFVQAVTWGFAHSSYPQQPAYARGVELTIGGLFDGWVLKRFGLLPCLIGHYLFDTFLGCKPLFSSPDAGLKITAFLSVVPFAVMFLLGLNKTKRLTETEPSEPLENQALPLKARKEDGKQLAEEEKAINYVPMTSKKRNAFVAVALISLLASVFMKPDALSDEATNKINRLQARKIAEGKMVEHGVNPVGWRVVASLSDQAILPSNQYLYEKLKFAKTDRLIKATHSGGYVWRVRFYKPMQAEEYEVQLDGEGREVGFDINLAEKDAGARLTKDEAIAAGEKEIKKNYPYLMPYVFESASEHIRDNRLDWTLNYKVPAYQAAEAPFKFTVSVVGNRVSGASWFWEVPDKWTWERNKSKAKDEIVDYLRSGLYVIFAGGALFWGFGVLRSGTIRWKSAIIFGLLLALLEIPEILNTLPTFYRFYRTTEPVSNFVMKSVVGDLQSFIYSFGMNTAMAAFAFASLRILFPKERLSALLLVLWKPVNAKARLIRLNMWVDGVAAAVCFISISLFLTSVTSVARAMLSPQVPEAYLGSVSSLQNLMFPILDLSKDAFSDGVREVLIAALAAGFYAKYCPKRWIFFAGIVIYSAVSAAAQRYGQDMAIDFLVGLLRYLLVYLFIARMAGKNIIAYFVYGLLSVLMGRLIGIYRHGLPLMLPELVFGVVFLFVPVLYAAYLAYKGHKEGRDQLTGEDSARLESV